MREMKIGAITVGQSPRTDVTGDILPIFQGKIELIERGALDGLTREDIARFAPRGDDYVLVSVPQNTEGLSTLRPGDEVIMTGVTLDGTQILKED